MDNLPLVQRVLALQSGHGRKITELRDFHRLLIRAAPFLRVMWVPSHGKRPEWRPLPGWPSEERQATAKLQVFEDWLRSLRAGREQARQWAAEALKVQSSATRSYHEEMVRLVAAKRHNR